MNFNLGMAIGGVLVVVGASLILVACIKWTLK